MKKLLWAAALAALAVLPATARADGIAFAGTENARSGVGSPGTGTRYATLSLPKQTVVTKLGPGGTILSYRAVRGQWGIPIVAFDGTKDGVSHDGKTLVLAQPPIGRMRTVSKFAVLSTKRLREDPRIVELRGSWSFDALSPDGKTLYLIEHVNRQDVSQYRVRAYDLEANRLLPRPIRDPKTGEVMHGYPMSRAASADGRWVYTLYQAADHSFVHALDTVARVAACVDLPKDVPPEHVADAELFFGSGGNLVVNSATGGVLAVIDTKTHDLRKPAATRIARAADVPWAAVGAGAATLVGILGLLVRRRLRSVPAVVADQRAGEPREGNSWADLEEEALLVAVVDAHDEAADRDPDAGSERRQEEEDHARLVPWTLELPPEGVIGDGRANGNGRGHDAREKLAGGGGPRGHRDDRRRQPAREHQPV